MADAHSPLAQFNVYPLFDFQLAGYDLSFTNASLMMMIVVGLVGLFMLQGKRKAALVPNRWQAANEMLIEFVEDMTRSNAGSEGMKYFALIFTIFVFILFANLLGMVPTAFTVTSWFRQAWPALPVIIPTIWHAMVDGATNGDDRASLLFCPPNQPVDSSGC